MYRISAPIAPPSGTTPSKYSSSVTWLWPRCAFLHSVDHGLQVRLQSRVIIGSDCITKLVWLLPPNVPPIPLDCSLQVHMITASMCISNLNREWAPSAWPNLSDRRLHLHLPTDTIEAYKCISKFTQPRPWRESLSSLHRSGVNQWSSQADSPLSTFHSASHGIHREFLRNSGSC